MLHTVYLPDFNKNRLSEIVALQVHLLNYAAENSLIDQTTCAAWLNAIPGIAGRGEKISDWLWRADARHESLEVFATRGPESDKRELCQQIQDDLEMFEAASGHLLFLSIPKDERNDYEIKVGSIPDWKIGVWDFLQNFYEEFRRSGFPKEIFSSNIAFRSQDFLREFVNANLQIHICPTCDESDYRAHLSSGILSEKDHYLPKSRYPHLSCHPLNLLPICPYCNRPKSDEDLLLNSRTGTRRNLRDIVRPYQENGNILRSGQDNALSSRSYLEITSAGTSNSSQFFLLKPRDGKEIEERIQAFCDTYQVPARWNADGRIEQIGERLFDRISEALRDAPVGFVDRLALVDVLDKLLDVLSRDQGKIPHSYAMVWWLVAIINQEIEPAVTASKTVRDTAFLQEIDVLFEQQKEVFSDLVDEIQIEASRTLLSSTSHRACIQAGRNIRQVAK